MTKHVRVGRSKARPKVSPQSAGGDTLYVLVVLADLRDKLDAITEKVTRRMKKLGLAEHRFDRP